MTSTLKLTSETASYLQKCFEEVAENGSIDPDQLEECLQIAGLDATFVELDWMIRHFDKNRNGKLEIKELIDNLPTLFAHSVREDELRAAFAFFDRDGDGYIRLPELKQVLTANDFMSAYEAGKLINELVEEFDSDHDGKFNYGEFMDIFLSGKYGFVDGTNTVEEHEQAVSSKKDRTNVKVKK